MLLENIANQNLESLQTLTKSVENQVEPHKSKFKDLG